MKKFIFGFLIGAVISFIISRLKEKEISHPDPVNQDEDNIYDIGSKIKKSERYKVHRLPYKDLPLAKNDNKSGKKKKVSK